MDGGYVIYRSLCSHSFLALSVFFLSRDGIRFSVRHFSNKQRARPLLGEPYINSVSCTLGNLQSASRKFFSVCPSATPAMGQPISLEGELFEGSISAPVYFTLREIVSQL